MARKTQCSLMCQTVKDNQCLIVFILAVTAFVEGIFELVRWKRMRDDLTSTARISIYLGIALLGLATLLFFLYREFRQLRNFGRDTLQPLNSYYRLEDQSQKPLLGHLASQPTYLPSTQRKIATGASSPEDEQTIIKLQEKLENPAAAPALQ